MSFAEFISYANLIMWWALVVCALMFAISGSDELFFDLVYWLHYTKTKYQNRKKPLVNYEDLIAVPEKRIAIMIPCWNEQLVIGNMLRHNLSAINYEKYDVFVGVYPNDPETIDAVKKIQILFPQIHYAISPTEGPTNKASNLNSIYTFIKQYENENNLKYDIFLFTDSEDVVHPLTLKLCNYLIPNYDMLQIPVFALEVKSRFFTHWIYNDEFAELHTKDLPSRGLIKGFIPSAGVGTAFSRLGLQRLAESRKNKLPFASNRLTEDYDTALKLQVLGLKAIFYTATVNRVEYRKKWFIFGRLIPRVIKERIATRALFQFRYLNALRQRARWVEGITLQEWAETGWPGAFPIKYTLAHDRKAIATNIINGFAYLVFLYWVISYFIYPGPLVISQLLKTYHWVWLVIIYCTVLMLNRILQRMIATGRIYGLWPAFLSIPRIFYANILNMNTSIIAVINYIRVATGLKPLTWAKSTNVFPTDEQLDIYKRKLGDLLLDKQIVTPSQMSQALNDQALRGGRLGEVLLRRRYINLAQLTQALAEQFKMKVVARKNCVTLSENELPKIAARNYQWLLAEDMIPIELTKNTVIIALSDPTDIKKQQRSILKLFPYKTKFVLFSMASRLGDLLISQGLITEEQLSNAMAQQLATGKLLGAILVECNYISVAKLNQALADQSNLEVVNIKKYQPLTAEDLEYITQNNYDWLVTNDIFPLSLQNQEIVFALKEPIDTTKRNEIIKRVYPYEPYFVLQAS